MRDVIYRQRGGGRISRGDQGGFEGAPVNPDGVLGLFEIGFGLVLLSEVFNEGGGVLIGRAEFEEEAKPSATDWERLSTMPDNAIDHSDNPELDSSFFANATIRMPEPKKALSMRIDSDVLRWYKGQGPGYQSRMNAVLRMYMKLKTGSMRPPSPKLSQYATRRLSRRAFAA